MKVLQITRQFLPSTGGMESVVEGLSHAIQQAGHDVRIVTLRKIFATGAEAPEQAEIDGLRVSRLNHWGIKRYPVAPSVYGHLAGNDVVHIHAVDFFVDFVSASKFVHRRPIVLSTHGGIFHTQWLNWFKSAYFRTVTKLALRNVAAVVCVSEQDYEVFSSVAPREKLHLIRNGVNIEPFLDIRKRITPGLLLGIGRVAENKSVDRLIQSVADLRATHPNLQLAWVGPDEHGNTAKLRQLADNLGVSDRVRFLGRVEKAELKDLLAKAHFFVSSSTYEGFGLSTVEAMSSGTVPVVTKVGAHPNIIKEGATGFLADSQQADITGRLNAALQVDLPRIQVIGEEARKSSLLYSWKFAAQNYMKIYQAAVQN